MMLPSCLRRLSTAALFLFFGGATTGRADHNDAHAEQEGFAWGIHATAKLPKGLSDFTATSVAKNADHSPRIYLAGGCDSVKGNQYDVESGNFFCDSVSDALYAFDEESATFETLPDLPVPRYRHAAVAVQNSYIVLLGGRDVDDNVVTQVDIFSISSETWSSLEGLPEEYWISDLAGFAGGNGGGDDGDTEGHWAYFAGGYNSTYSALSTTFRVDVVQSLSSGSVVADARSALMHARGDVSAATTADGRSAILTGGFSHENDWCEPIQVVEMYNFRDDEWRIIAPLIAPRSDKALVEFKGAIYAIGGERQIEDICERVPDDPPEPGEKTVAVDDVEVYDPSHDEWNVLTEMPNHRFRFAAAASNGDQVLYGFGGQTAYEDSCQCFPTTDEVVVFGDPDSELFVAVSQSSGVVAAVAAASSLSFASWLLLAASHLLF